LKIRCNNTIQRRGGFSPPGFVIEAIGRGKPAPTLLRLIFKDHYIVAEYVRLKVTWRIGEFDEL
jgi:hypothetical protein